MKHVSANLSGRRTQRPWSSENVNVRACGDAICPRCEAVHRDKRWSRDRRLHEELRRVPGTPEVVCAACKMQEQGLIEGVVRVRAAWTPQQCHEAVQLARNEEEREAAKNAVHRIASVEISNEGLELTTTTEFLARHLARRIEKTFNGKRLIRQAPGEKFVCITVTLSAQA